MTVNSISLDARQGKQYAKFLRKAPKIAREEFKLGLTEALLLLEREIKDDTPIGVGGAAGLRGSTTHDMRGTRAGTLQGRVFSPLQHAQAVEYGTKPHPVSREGQLALKDWVEKKLGVDPSESASVAYLVARKIAREGTEGAHMFEDNLSLHASQVNNMLSAALDRIIGRWQAGQR